MASRQGASPQGRAVIIAKGRVQRVGYRHKVEEIAYKNNLLGSVENLKDGSVRIVCEGAKKEIKEFYKQINLKEKWPIDVRELSPLRFETPAREFSDFRKKRSPFALLTELPSRADVVVSYMQSMDGRMENLHSEMRDFRGDMNQKFNSLDKRYGAISKNIAGFRSDANKNFSNLDGKFDSISTNLDQKFDSISKNIEMMSGIMRQLSRDIRVLVKKAVEPSG